MKVILIITVAFLIFSCNKKQEKSSNNTNKTTQKTTTQVKAIQKVDKKVKKVKKEFNIEKNCSVCHNLPKFSEKEKDYLSQKLDLHRKLRRITLDQKDFDKLKERILKKAKKSDSKIKK